MTPRERLDESGSSSEVLDYDDSIEPECGWKTGFVRLSRGRCPYCGGELSRPRSEPDRSGLTWACMEGCNP